MRCRVAMGTPQSDLCATCNHYIGSHTYPAGVCMECAAVAVERLEMQMERTNTVVEQLIEDHGHEDM